MPKDFFLIDDWNRPYRVRVDGNRHWLHYLHPDKMWVKLRPVEPAQVELYHLHALEPEKAKQLEYGVPLLAN